jgi:tetratricopeptide (TPR) repeat protein
MKKKISAHSPVLGLLLAVVLTACAPRAMNEEQAQLYARAQGLYGQGRFSEAAVLLEGAGRLPPVLLLRGKAMYFAGGEEPAAEKLFRETLKKRPGSEEARFFLARICLETDRHDEAQSLVEEILADYPQDLRALRLAAELNFARGPEGEAAGRAFLDKALETGGEYSLALLDRARQRWLRGDGQGALADLRRARALLGGESPITRAIAGLEGTITRAGGGK